MQSRRTVLLEGFTADEILAVPAGDLDALVFVGEPVVFRVGSAEVLGEFRCRDARLILELAHIDGGGEGVLPTLGSLAQRYAAREGLDQIEWIVHAVTCAAPNPRLKHMLERRGFTVAALPGVGDAYHAIESVHRALPGSGPCE